MAYELFSRKYRVAFFSLRSYLTETQSFSFDWPIKHEKKGFFWTDIPHEENMHEILKNLLSIKEYQWYSIIDKFCDIAGYDFNNKKIKSTLSEFGIEVIN